MSGERFARIVARSFGRGWSEKGAVLKTQALDQSVRKVLSCEFRVSGCRSFEFEKLDFSIGYARCAKNMRNCGSSQYRLGG